MMTDLGAAVVGALAWMPDWMVSLLMFAGAILMALVAQWLVTLLARRLLARKSEFWRNTLARIRRPLGLALIMVLSRQAAEVSPLTTGQTAMVQQSLLVIFIIMVGWMVFIAIDVASAIYMRRFRTDVEDNLVARKHITQIRILRRAAATLVVIVTAGLALMSIEAFREWGVSLLAAGGAAGILVGLSLQPLITNMIAGVQIAMTQPIRIDDAVVVEDERGWIEEINATYVVIRLWDRRRLVVPLTYFITTPFQNWTRDSASLIGTAMFQVSYTAPVEAMREKLGEICKATPLWDGRVVNLQVTDTDVRTMQVRCLASARNAPATFDLRCIIREKMIDWLKTQHPDALLYDRNLAEWADQKAGWPATAPVLADALLNRPGSEDRG
jgi:small-conductance mechanosensitive channel